jgi:hypothetical protein
MPDGLQKDEPWMKIYYRGHGQWRAKFLVTEQDGSEGWTESGAMAAAALARLIDFMAGKYETYWAAHRISHDAG